jgi:hypothetical protein
MQGQNTRRKAFRGTKLVDPDKRRDWHQAAKLEMKSRREASLDALTTEDGWQTFVEAAVRFPYSWRNCALVAERCPGATLLMTAGRWKSEGVYVREGESSVWVFRPEPGKGFRTVDLFDISQTRAPAEYMETRVGWSESDERELAEAVAEALAAIPAPIDGSREQVLEAAKRLYAHRKGEAV